MRIRVAFGRLSGDDLKRASCPRCRGEGSCETHFQSGRTETCPRCQGSGDDPFQGFTYSTDVTVSRGDVVLVGVQRWGEPYQQVEATVVGIGSTYEGDARRVIRVVQFAS